MLKQFIRPTHPLIQASGLTLDNAASDAIEKAVQKQELKGFILDVTHTLQQKPSNVAALWLAELCKKISLVTDQDCKNTLMTYIFTPHLDTYLKVLMEKTIYYPLSQETLTSAIGSLKVLETAGCNQHTVSENKIQARLNDLNFIHRLRQNVRVVNEHRLNAYDEGRLQEKYVNMCQQYVTASTAVLQNTIKKSKGSNKFFLELLHDTASQEETVLRSKPEDESFHVHIITAFAQANENYLNILGIVNRLEDDTKRYEEINAITESILRIEDQICKRNLQDLVEAYRADSRNMFLAELDKIEDITQLRSFNEELCDYESWADPIEILGENWFVSALPRPTHEGEVTTVNAKSSRNHSQHIYIKEEKISFEIMEADFTVNCHTTAQYIHLRKRTDPHEPDSSDIVFFKKNSILKYVAKQKIKKYLRHISAYNKFREIKNIFILLSGDHLQENYQNFENKLNELYSYLPDCIASPEQQFYNQIYTTIKSIVDKLFIPTFKTEYNLLLVEIFCPDRKTAERYLKGEAIDEKAFNTPADMLAKMQTFLTLTLEDKGLQKLLQTDAEYSNAHQIITQLNTANGRKLETKYYEELANLYTHAPLQNKVLQQIMGFLLIHKHSDLQQVRLDAFVNEINRIDRIVDVLCLKHIKREGGPFSFIESSRDAQQVMRGLEALAEEKDADARSAYDAISAEYKGTLGRALNRLLPPQVQDRSIPIVLPLPLPQKPEPEPPVSSASSSAYKNYKAKQTPIPEHIDEENRKGLFGSKTPGGKTLRALPSLTKLTGIWKNFTSNSTANQTTLTDIRQSIINNSTCKRQLSFFGCFTFELFWGVPTTLAALREEVGKWPEAESNVGDDIIRERADVLLKILEEGHARQYASYDPRVRTPATCTFYNNLLQKLKPLASEAIQSRSKTLSFTPSL